VTGGHRDALVPRRRGDNWVRAWRTRRRCVPRTRAISAIPLGPQVPPPSPRSHPTRTTSRSRSATWWGPEKPRSSWYLGNETTASETGFVRDAPVGSVKTGNRSRVDGGWDQRKHAGRLATAVARPARGYAQKRFRCDDEFKVESENVRSLKEVCKNQTFCSNEARCSVAAGPNYRKLIGPSQEGCFNEMGRYDFAMMPALRRRA